MARECLSHGLYTIGWWGDTRRWCGIAVRLLRGSFPAQAWKPAAWQGAELLEPHVLTATSHAEAAGCELAAVS